MMKKKQDKIDHKEIDVGCLKLDSCNPRLPQSLKNKEEKKIIAFLLLESSTLELMQAIGENDFFPGEQLLVVSDNDDKGKYLVVEGNRRLASVKLLSDKGLATVQKSKVKRVYEEAKHRPKKIPCLIFPDKSQILKYLGYRHITGVKSWKLLEKARYLSGLKEKQFPDDTFDDSCRKLAKMIGSRKDYVRRIVTGYEIYTEIEDRAFFKISSLNDTTFFFNYIADSLRQNNITEFLGIDLSDENPIQNLDKKNLKEWTHWLFEKNAENKTRLLGTSDDLNKLNKVIGNPEAFKCFAEKGYSLYSAYELTNDLDTVFKKYIKGSYEKLKQANNLLHKVNSFYEDLDDDLRNIQKLVRIIKSVNNEIDE